MDDDEETLCRYGTALPAYEEDEIPSKKPVSVEDQIVLDINGKRRFHGAFTGGFSAGYWNTVGSQEGWKPTEFKSSRGEKASLQAKRPIDYMDDEDLGEFGIAPQRVQTKEDFAHSSKTTKRRITQGNWNGPIPGQPVLKSLLEPTKEKTAVKILKNMGWREGQGVGERQSKADKKKAKERNQKEMYVMKMYGCAIPGRSSQPIPVEDSDSESDLSEYEVSFAPDDFDPLVAAIKDNTFGLGYSGLERNSTHTQRFNLFDTLEVVDKNNKKLSIRGQAFGIGAFEDDDDEDVYAKDDMSRYDFSLEDKAKKPAAIKSAEHAGGLEGFCPSKKSGKQIKKVFRVKMPEDYVPRNWTERRSRFEPMNDLKLKQFTEKNQYKIQGLGRHDLDPQKRGQVLGEVPMKATSSTRNPILDLINKRSENFVSGEIINCDTPASIKPIEEKSEKQKLDPLNFDLKAEMANLGSTKDGFKPFIADPDKQERYDKYISFQSSERYKNKEDFLGSLQPLGMSSWDRERELKEFAQAQRMYRPLDGLMSDRFVTESSLVAEKEAVDATKPMEINMKRTRVMWKPHKELCKRFNVPEPFGGMLEHEKEKPKTKFSVFDYLETPVNSKKDFVTPVIIPKTVSKEEKKDKESRPVRVSAKDFFSELDQTTATVATPERPPAQLRTVPEQLHSNTLKKPEKRSELEQMVLDSVNKKPEEKKDLFKSIFCSSDEEEEESSEKHGFDSKAESTMSEKEKLKLVESLVAIKPASQVNILRNDSPPRGIFKSILEIKNPKEIESQLLQNEDSEDSSSSSEDDAYYGPKLPMKPSTATSSTASDKDMLDARLKTLVEKTRTGYMIEKWVEKDKTSSNKSKKKKHKEHKKTKKHKKDKKKHKHKEKR